MYIYHSGECRQCIRLYMYIYIAVLQCAYINKLAIADVYFIFMVIQLVQ
jgi:hypothetical protein